jgi:hypothetical protein
MVDIADDEYNKKQMATLTMPFRPAALATNLLATMESGDAAGLQREVVHTRRVLKALDGKGGARRAEFSELLDALTAELESSLHDKSGTLEPLGQGTFPAYLLRHVAACGA